MSSKYVPPHKRNTNVPSNKFEVLNIDDEEEEIVKPEEKKEEFPSLVTTTNAVTKTWEGSKKFSDVAVQYKIRSEEQKTINEIENNVNMRYGNNRDLPVFHNPGRFIEPEDDNVYNYSKRVKVEENDEGWTSVSNKKLRKPKNMEEIANRPPTPEEERWDDPDKDNSWDEN
jgi:hypothetical protein